MPTPRTQLCHFSYHKCLTVYFSQVMNRTFATIGRSGITSGYRHLNSLKSELSAALLQNRLVSLNNHAVDPDSLGNFRATRFVRDPRDLLVSGYFYHRRAAEPWCSIENPTAADWAVDQVFSHYGIRGPRRAVGLMAAQRFSSTGRESRSQHIRNPRSGQWKDVLTPRVLAELDRRHPEAILRYGSRGESS